MSAMTFEADGDLCLSLWGEAMAQMPIIFPPDATVLEIGCAEADWMTPMLKVRPDLKITGIDWRACERPGLVYRANVLAAEFPPDSFDAVVGISSIEHIGLGHYDDDPLDVDGDRHTMERVVRWLKPGGFVYCDVPYDMRGYRVCETSHRVYDDQAILDRIVVPGLRLKAQAFHLPSDGMNYTMVLAEKRDGEEEGGKEPVALGATR